MALSSPAILADRRMFHPAAALQRGIDRLSARRGVRRRAGAADRNGAARGDRIGPGDRALHLWLCDRQHRRDGGPAEQQGSGFRAGPNLIIGWAWHLLGVERIAIALIIEEDPTLRRWRRDR